MASEQVTAWRPRVAGVREVLHAHFTGHVYPMHSHDAWTLLIVDSGAVTYDLDRHVHAAARPTVTLLPPGVPHNGAAATADGFRKRVVYLEQSELDDDLVGRSADTPMLPDPELRQWIDHLHRSLARPGDEFEAESVLALVQRRLRQDLRPVPDPRGFGTDRPLARRLRELLDARVADGVSLAEAAAALHAHPAHLVRSFRREFGLPPHQYLSSLRVDRARRLLLDDMRPSEVAHAVGFYDQAHLNRHFKRFLGVTPGRFRAPETVKG